MHKATGWRYVVLNGRPVYLGRWNRPETEQRYHQIIATWSAGRRQLCPDPDTPTAKEPIARLWQRAAGYHL